MTTTCFSIVSLVAALFFLSACTIISVSADPTSGELTVYVGTYTAAKSKGIYMMKMDPATGKLSEPEVAGELANPSFITLGASRKFMYAVSEGKNGIVSALSIDPGTGKLTLLNQQPSGGADPCFIGLDAAGKVAMVANYSSGTIESLSIGDDGKLSAPVTHIQDAGPVADAKRQGGPHAHSINVDPSGKFALAADLGLDKMFVYKLDSATGTLTPNEPPFVKLSPRSGPRHLAFHPNGKFAYVINEIALTVTAFAYDADKGTLSELQTIGTVAPSEVRDENSSAEVQVHPSGKFLYGSNRGPNTIAIFAIDQETGKLTAVGHQSTGGKTPRNFRMDPAGNFLLAANQDSDSVVVFKIDQATGALTPTGQSVKIGSPVCVKFMK
jgi:6-phosphogluconolactonase